MASGPAPPAAMATDPVPAAAIASFNSSPDWMILDRFVRRRDDDGSFPADDPTAASLANSRGDPFDVCLRVDAPPRASTLYLRWPEGPKEGEPCEPASAHRGAVLLLLHYAVPVNRGHLYPMIDYAVYNAAGTGAPSLRLLPPLGGTIEEIQARVAAEGYRGSLQLQRRMDALDIGVLRRGPQDLAVAELKITRCKSGPELRVLINPSGSNDDQWALKRPEIVPVHPKDLDMEHFLWYWDADVVVPFGSQLCWVDYSHGILFCDVFAEIPKLSYLELPAKIPGLSRNPYGRGWLQAYQTVGITKGDTMKFVTVVRADGLIIESYDPAYDFTITSWTLKITEVNRMVWEKDSEVTASQLWALDDFVHLPRSLLLYPIFSMDDPNVVCFVLRQKGKVQKGGRYNYGEVHLVAIDMINMNLKSNVLYTKNEENPSHDEAELYERKSWFFEPFLPSELTKHLNLRDNSGCAQELALDRHALKRKLDSCI